MACCQIRWDPRSPALGFLRTARGMRQTEVVLLPLAKRYRKGERIRRSGRCYASSDDSSDEWSFARSDESDRSKEFAARLEQAWSIRKNQGPVACEECMAQGCIECNWCRGTGYFIVGDNMLCSVSSRSNTCVICGGKGTVRCLDCAGTGFRARWLKRPTPGKQPSG